MQTHISSTDPLETTASIQEVQPSPESSSMADGEKAQQVLSLLQQVLDLTGNSQYSPNDVLDKIAVLGEEVSDDYSTPRKTYAQILAWEEAQAEAKYRVGTQEGQKIKAYR